MKKILFFLAFMAAVNLDATVSTNVFTFHQSATVIGYQIGEQGANHRVWQKIVRTTDPQGNVILTTNRAYVQLATGLNFRDPTTGQWRPANEEIDAYSDGAIAQYGRHKVIFANNLHRRRD